MLIMIEREIITDLDGQIIVGWVIIGLCVIMLIYDADKKFCIVYFSVL